MPEGERVRGYILQRRMIARFRARLRIGGTSRGLTKRVVTVRELRFMVRSMVSQRVIIGCILNRILVSQRLVFIMILSRILIGQRFAFIVILNRILIS